MNGRSAPGIRAKRAAFTLLEVMVAVAILGLGLTVILTAQSLEGIGTEHEAARLVQACSGGMVVLRCARPEPVLQLAGTAVADVRVVTRGSWRDAVALPGLGADLLDGMALRGATAFETWLLAQQRHMAAASEAILHEAALGSMARGALDEAIGYAVRAAAMSPLDENHQALLIRLYRTVGDDEAAARQFAAFTKVLRAELDVAPGPAVQAAMRQPRAAPV